MINRRLLRRGFSNVMVGFMVCAVIVALLPLFFILVNLLIKGAGSLSLDFFTKSPTFSALGESGGGIANSIVGSVVLVGLLRGIGAQYVVAPNAVDMDAVRRVCADLIRDQLEARARDGERR